MSGTGQDHHEVNPPADPAAPADSPPPATCGAGRECRHQRSIKWATWAMVILMLAGALIGYWTYHIYRKQLEVQMFKGLTDQDQAILEKNRQKSHLEAFYVELPKGMDPLERADRRIRLIVDEERLGRPWRDIADLACLLFEEEDFHSPAKARLRATYGAAEDMLYLLSNVFNAYSAELLAKEDYQTWVAYLPEVGDHPLFLTAVFYWHDANYLSTELAAELRDRLCRPNTHTRATIEALFPEMIEANWPGRVGQGKISCPAARGPAAGKPPTLLRLRERAPGPAAPAGGAESQAGAD